MQISACFVVYNEELRLPAAIESIRPWVDEVVVAVQESSDRTLELARALADVVLEHPHHGHAAPSRLPTYQRASGVWVLALDADETLTARGKEQLRAWTADPEVHLYRLRERTVVDGQVIEDTPHARLFQLAKLTDPVWALHKEGSTSPERTREVTDFVVIEHVKTSAEQRADDARYVELMTPEGYATIANHRKILSG